MAYPQRLQTRHTFPELNRRYRVNDLNRHNCTPLEVSILLFIAEHQSSNPRSWQAHTATTLHRRGFQEVPETMILAALRRIKNVGLLEAGRNAMFYLPWLTWEKATIRTRYNKITPQTQSFPLSLQHKIEAGVIWATEEYQRQLKQEQGVLEVQDAPLEFITLPQ